LGCSSNSKSEAENNNGNMDYDDPFAYHTDQNQIQSQVLRPLSGNVEPLSTATSMLDFIASLGEGWRQAEGLEDGFAQNYPFVFPTEEHGFRGVIYADGSWKLGTFSCAHSRQYKRFSCDKNSCMLLTELNSSKYTSLTRSDFEQYRNKTWGIITSKPRYIPTLLETCVGCLKHSAAPVFITACTANAKIILSVSKKDLWSKDMHVALNASLPMSMKR
jgi:hypothetical protein